MNNRTIGLLQTCHECGQKVLAVVDIQGLFTSAFFVCPHEDCRLMHVTFLSMRNIECHRTFSLNRKWPSSLNDFSSIVATGLEALLITKGVIRRDPKDSITGSTLSDDMKLSAEEVVSICVGLEQFRQDIADHASHRSVFGATEAVLKIFQGQRIGAMTHSESGSKFSPISLQDIPGFQN